MRAARLSLLRTGMALGGALMLADCAAFSPDGGMGPVATYASQELGKDVAAIRNKDDADAARAAVERLLKRPLTADAAVQIALLNNRRLQAAYNELAVAEADLVQASLPPNPTFSLMRIAGSGELEIERRIIADILALATLPARSDIAADRFRQAQLRAIGETVRVAVETRRAWYRTVAANETGRFLAQAQTAAESATQLAKTPRRVRRAEQARSGARSGVLRRSHGAGRHRAPTRRKRTRTADPAARPVGQRSEFPAGERPAVAAGPAAGAARGRDGSDPPPRRSADRADRGRCAGEVLRADAMRRASSICWRWRAYRRPAARRDATVRQRGIEVDFQIPLFDFGEVRVRDAEQTYLAAVNRLTDKAIVVRSEARDAYRVYRASYDIAAHYQREILPLRKIISDETLLRYNAMQIDVFSLLAEARQRIAATTAAIEAQRDFWLANTNLVAAVAGTGPAGDTGDSTKTAAATTGDAAGH